MKWLKVHWPTQKEWGATSVKLWNGENGQENVLFCRYTVASIEDWNKGMTSPEAEHSISELAEIVDMDQLSMKITVLSADHAG